MAVAAVWAKQPALVGHLANQEMARPLGPQGGTFAGSEACTCRVHKRFIVGNPWPPG